MIVKGKLKLNNLLGFIVFSMVYFTIQNLAFTTMWVADDAQINVGIITAIWSINPLFIAVSDYLIYGIDLKQYHLLAMIALVVCVLSISFAGNDGFIAVING